MLNKLLNDDTSPLTYTSPDGNAHSFEIKQFQPGTHSSYIKGPTSSYWKSDFVNKPHYYMLDNIGNIEEEDYTDIEINGYMITLYEKLNDAVRKRVIGTSDRIF